MMVLDTSVLIDVLRGDSRAVGFVDSLAERPACSEVTRVKVLRGVRSRERRATEQLLAGLRWIPVDEGIARRAGEFGRDFARSHSALSTPDLIVAATAAELDVELATANVRDFPMFRRIKAPY